MKNNMIIGITGTDGSGKGTVVDYLKTKGYRHYSVREFLLNQIRKMGLPENRDSMVKVANDLRKQHSASYIVEELYKQAKQAGGKSIIESLRTPGEVAALKNKGEFYLFTIEADQKTRYERIRKRGSETDSISFEQFVHDEEREMHSDDPAKQNIGQCIKMANFVLNNDGSFAELYGQVNKILKKICA